MNLFYLATSVLQSDTENRLMMMEGHMAQRKVPSCIPHDIGDPGNVMPRLLNLDSQLTYLFLQRGCFLTILPSP